MGKVFLKYDSGIIQYTHKNKAPNEEILPEYKLIFIEEVCAFESTINSFSNNMLEYSLIFILKGGQRTAIELYGTINSYRNHCTQIHRAVFNLGLEGSPKLTPVK